MISFRSDLLFLRSLGCAGGKVDMGRRPRPCAGKLRSGLASGLFRGHRRIQKVPIADVTKYMRWFTSYVRSRPRRESAAKRDRRSICRKCRPLRQGRVGHVPLFGQKLINIGQRIVAQKSMLVAITAPLTGTITVTESVVLPPDLREEHHAPITGDNLFKVPIRNVPGKYPRRSVRV